MRIEFNSPPQVVRQVRLDLEQVKKEKDEAITDRKYEIAAELREKENELTEKLVEVEKDWESDRGEDIPIVSQDHIGEVVSMWTGIPVTRLTLSETERLINMEEVISEQVIGQDEAVTSVSKAVRRARSGMKNPKRPVGAFMFLGPTGVGKT